MCPYLNFGNKQGNTKVMKAQVIKVSLIGLFSSKHKIWYW